MLRCLFLPQVAPTSTYTPQSWRISYLALTPWYLFSLSHSSSHTFLLRHFLGTSIYVLKNGVDHSFIWMNWIFLKCWLKYNLTNILLCFNSYVLGFWRLEICPQDQPNPHPFTQGLLLYQLQPQQIRVPHLVEFSYLTWSHHYVKTLYQNIVSNLGATLPITLILCYSTNRRFLRSNIFSSHYSVFLWTFSCSLCCFIWIYMLLVNKLPYVSKYSAAHLLLI